MEENKNNLNGPQKKNNNNNKKYLIIYVIVAFMFIYSFNYAKNMLTTQEISYNKFMQLVENGEISEVRTLCRARCLSREAPVDQFGKS